MDRDIVFTEEALRAQEGKTVPLTDEPGGRIIGEATMYYDDEAGELRAKMTVTDPAMAEFFGQDADSLIFKKGC